MRFSRTSKALGVAAIIALAATGCGGGGSNDSGTSAGDPNKVIIADGSEPQRPLMPADINEVGGGKIATLIFSGLVSYDPSGKPVNELAESIEAPDAQNFTIKIKKDQKFTNGDTITAKTFVDSWNYGAAAKNAQLSATFFESIKGYDETSAEGSTVETMSGLKVVDDTTFTVELKQPESDWPLRLGYTAFMPVPAAALADPKTYGEKPVGNGPYKMAENGWQHNVQIQLVPNPEYNGPRKAKNGGVTFKIFQNDDAAYQDLLSNNLDILQVVPTSALKNFKTDLPDRYIEKPYAGNQTIAIPEYLPEWSGEAGKLRRQAISMAINRDEITKVIFSGGRQPAKDFTAPVLDGFSDSIPGSDNLKFNADKAKELWAKADSMQKWDPNTVFTVAYNADKGGHKAWVEALTNQLKNNLGIKAEGLPVRYLQGSPRSRHHRQADRCHPRRLAGRLPVAVQLPRPDLQDRCRLERCPLREPHVRQGDLRWPLCPQRFRGQQGHEQGAGDTAHRPSRHPAVVPGITGRLEHRRDQC